MTDLSAPAVDATPESADTAPLAVSRTVPLAIDPSTYLRKPTAVQRVQSGLRVVTVAGWFALAGSVLGWVVGWRAGWSELMHIAAVALVCLVAALVQVLGRTNAEVEVAVQPQRVVVGQRSAAQVTVRNSGGRRRLPTRMELTVGEGVAEFAVPSVGGGDEYEELFTLPTHRRAVIPVGPATAVRGDPLGLLRRAAPLTEPVPLIVHPRIVALGSMWAGLLRDLEGQTTPELSPADVAFHALRDYEPGDDRRFIHWLTTARVNRLVVRQFNDTRRAHVVVLLDSDARSFVDPAVDFETAVSVVGSLGVRTLSDDQGLTVSVGGHRLPSFGPQVLLDALAAVDLGGRRQSLAAHATPLARQLSDVSLAVFVTGTNVSVADLRSAALRFGAGVRTLAIQVGPGGSTRFHQVDSMTVVHLASLEDLTRVMWAVTQS